MKFNQWICALAAAAFLAPGKAGAQDPELSNYKCGISMTFSGVKGVDYVEEYRYHDKLVTDAKVIYIKDSTLISLFHNERNILAKRNVGSGVLRLIGANGLDGVPNTGDEGIIRYKVDRDRWYGGKWAHASNPKEYHPQYSAPFSFSSLSYETGVPVVGTTGPKPGIALTAATKNTYYHRGILDSVGDEWHTICVADDDQFVPDVAPKEEFYSSDGKMFVFVVNPKTPAMTIRATGNAQFYTTPPKIYFNPVIYDQTTYFMARSGGVTFELRDINGNNVFYRVVSNPADASTPYTNGGSGGVTLNQSHFASGTSYLQYYYAGNQAHTKTRKVVKDPAFPSAGESHGNLLWEDAAEKAKILARLERAPYLAPWNNILTKDDNNGHSYWDNNGHQGHRRSLFTPTGSFTANGYEPSAANAFVAVAKGNDYTRPGKSKSYAQYAKEMLLENQRVLDNVGWEASWSGNPHPVTELCGGGYYVVNCAINSVMAYDMLIAQYRSDQHANGITPVEDYFIRDLLASHVFQSMSWNGHYNNMEPGMWGTAQDMAAHAIAFCMKSYSTPYYGTSGFDGNTTTYYNCPYPDVKYTWKQVFSDRDLPLTAYPNLRFRFDVERPDLFVSTPPADYGNWSGNISYFSGSLMGGRYSWYANVMKINDSYDISVVEEAFAKATSGTIISIAANGTRSAPTYYPMTPVLNSRFPAAQALGVPILQGAGTENSEVNGAGLQALLWYDDVLAPDTPSIYEGFDYAPTTNVSTAPDSPSDTGWLGTTWNASNDIVSPGLNYPGMPVLGNALQFSGNTESRRTIDMDALPPEYSSVNSDGVTRLGAHGSELWLRFLIRFDADDPTGSLLGGLSLIGSGTGGSLKLRIGDSGSNANWSVATGAGLQGNSSVPIVTGDTVLLVVRMKFVEASNQDEVDLFVNPPMGANPPATPSATLRNFNLGSFNLIELKGPRNGTIDEISIETDWDRL